MKNRTKKTMPVKKVGKDFCGTCELRQLPKGSYFRIVDKKRESKQRNLYERLLRFRFKEIQLRET